MAFSAFMLCFVKDIAHTGDNGERNQHGYEEGIAGQGLAFARDFGNACESSEFAVAAVVLNGLLADNNRLRFYEFPSRLYHLRRLTWVRAAS